MEIVSHKQKMLYAMESNAKGNNNFAVKVISTENVEGKSCIFLKKYGRSKKNESNFFSHFSSYDLHQLVEKLTSLEYYYNFKVLTCDIQRMSFFKIKDHHHHHHHHHHKPFTSLFYILFGMYDMGKASHAHLNT